MDETRAWSLLTITDEERQFAGNLGYEDALGVRYVWDTTVPSGRRVGVGDLIVMRDSRSVLGVGWIDAIETATVSKKRLRCPGCHGTSFKKRKTLSPPFKCADRGCAVTFVDPDSEDLQVIVSVATYGRTWRPLDGVPVTVLGGAFRSGSYQHAIRELEVDAIHDVLNGRVVVDPAWWTAPEASSDVVAPTIRGGHVPAVTRRRVGQDRFRELLLRRFGEICAMTGPQPVAALEAAHLYRYADVGHHDVRGGLLLRRDLHAVFDDFLIGVDVRTWTLRVSPLLERFPHLMELEGRPLHVDEGLRPTASYLEAHLAQVVAASYAGPIFPGNQVKTTSQP